MAVAGVLVMGMAGLLLALLLRLRWLLLWSSSSMMVALRASNLAGRGTGMKTICERELRQRGTHPRAKEEKERGERLRRRRAYLAEIRILGAAREILVALVSPDEVRLGRARRRAHWHGQRDVGRQRLVAHRRHHARPLRVVLELVVQRRLPETLAVVVELGERRTRQRERVQLEVVEAGGEVGAAVSIGGVVVAIAVRVGIVVVGVGVNLDRVRRRTVACFVLGLDQVREADLDHSREVAHAVRFALAGRFELVGRRLKACVHVCSPPRAGSVRVGVEELEMLGVEVYLSSRWAAEKKGPGRCEISISGPAPHHATVLRRMAPIACINPARNLLLHNLLVYACPPSDCVLLLTMCFLSQTLCACAIRTRIY